MIEEAVAKTNDRWNTHSSKTITAGVYDVLLSFESSLGSRDVKKL